jgi:hypothetical protein
VTKKTITVTLRISEELHASLQELGDIMNIEAHSYLYRWILESFVETVHDQEDPPALPAVTTLARRLVRGTKEHHAEENDD